MNLPITITITPVLTWHHMKLYIEDDGELQYVGKMWERKFYKIELIDQTKEFVSIIKRRLKLAQDRQKSYIDT